MPSSGLNEDIIFTKPTKTHDHRFYSDVAGPFNCSNGLSFMLANIFPSSALYC